MLEGQKNLSIKAALSRNNKSILNNEKSDFSETSQPFSIRAAVSSLAQLIIINNNKQSLRRKRPSRKYVVFREVLRKKIKKY